MRILRSYQVELLSHIAEAWQNHKNILAVSPTGTGKSVIITETSRHLENPVTLVHRNELIEQLSLSLGECGLHHNIIGADGVIKDCVASHRDKLDQIYYSPHAKETIMSVDTMVRRNTRYDSIFRRCKGVRIDEGHHLLKGNKWGKVFERFPSDCKLLGLTATPKRLDGKGLSLDTDGYYEKLIQSHQVKWFIDNKYLCPYEVILPDSNLEKYIWQKPSQGSDFNQGVLHQAFEQSKIIGDIVFNWFKYAFGKQTILFAPSVLAGEQITQMFIDNGVSARMLHSKTEKTERTKIMRQFKDKSVTLLSNVALFDEGIDISGVNCVMHLRPTMSLARYMQVNGRGLRMDGDDKVLTIMDFTSNTFRHNGVDPNRYWTLDRYRRSTSDHSIIRRCQSCFRAILKSKLRCPYCGVVTPSLTSKETVTPQMVSGDMSLVDMETMRKMTRATHLDDGQAVWDRIRRVYGKAAANKAKLGRSKRISTQNALKQVIKQWEMRVKLPQRESDMEFYNRFGLSKLEALSKTTSSMLSIISKIGGNK